MTNDATNWEGKCKRELMASLDKVRAALERFTQPGSMPADELRFDNAVEEGSRIILPAGYHSFSDEPVEPSALERLCKLFQLSEFEKSILLLCAGMEVRADFASLCATAHGDPRMNYPTFSLALAVFTNPEWKAFAPSSRLRRWRLIEVGRGERVTASSIKIDTLPTHGQTTTSPDRFPSFKSQAMTPRENVQWSPLRAPPSDFNCTRCVLRTYRPALSSAKPSRDCGSARPCFPIARS